MVATHTVSVRRIDADPSPDDGARVLVDRLWPRGVSKERAALNEWLKGVTRGSRRRRNCAPGTARPRQVR